MQSAVALACFPTLLWCLLWAWVRTSGLSLRWLLGGILVGALLGGPVWLLETAVDGLANPGGRLWRDFVQQVLGAACCEELLKFLAIALLLWFAKRRRKLTTRDIVAIAISVGVGFMTLENVLAVALSDTPMSIAIDRQLTIIAGHGSYQTIMGFLLALSARRSGFGWNIVALAAPIFLHGWGDLSERLFQDEPNPGSLEDTLLFGSWIASVVTTAVVAFGVLWWVRRAESDETLNQPPS